MSGTLHVCAGKADGKWSRIEPLITERLVKRGVAVTVYDHGEGGG